MTIDDAWVERTCGATFRRIGDEVIVAVPGHDDFVVLAGSAVAVWSLLDVRRTVRNLVDVLASEHRHAPDVIREDVRGVLETLRERGAVEVTDGRG